MTNLAYDDNEPEEHIFPVEEKKDEIDEFFENLDIDKVPEIEF